MRSARCGCYLQRPALRSPLLPAIPHGRNIGLQINFKNGRPACHYSYGRPAPALPETM